MKVETEFNRGHALCEAEHLTEVKNRNVPLNTELLANLELSAVELELTEWTGVDNCVCASSCHVGEFFVGDVECVCDVVSTDTSACSTALHLVSVLDCICTECVNKLLEPGRVLGVADDRVLELAVLCRLE